MTDDLTDAERARLGFTHDATTFDLEREAERAARRRMYAFHEAGHTVARFDVQGELSFVVIGNGDFSSSGLGGFSGRGVIGPDTLRLDKPLSIDAALDADASLVASLVELLPHRNSQTAAWLLAHQMVIMAGPIAQHVASGIPLPTILERDGATDLEMCERYQSMLNSVIELDRDQHWDGLVECTRELIVSQWPRIELVANALLERGKLLPRDVAELLGDSNDQHTAKDSAA